MPSSDGGNGNVTISGAGSPLRAENIPNIRDLSEACPRLLAGKLVRCAMPSKASDADTALLLDSVGIRDMIDLRASEEIQEDSPDSHLFNRSSFVRWERHWATGQVQCMEEYQRSGATVLRHNVSLLERRRYLRGLLWKAPISTILTAAALGVVDREAARLVMLQEVNAGGLALLYNIILEIAKPELCTVMNIVLSGLEADRPLMFFCKAGKDRTGIVAMLILSCCGVSEEKILADYHLSDAIKEVALAGIENKPELKGLDHVKFEGAPIEAMETTLEYIRNKYGSPRMYLTSIGFGHEKQQRIAAKLVQ